MVSLKELLSELQPDLLFTQLKCDEPFFIRASMPYNQAYQHFIEAKFFETDFLISPKPEILQDIMLNRKTLDIFFLETLKHSKSLIEMHSVFVAEKKKRDEFEVNNFFGPLLWSFNNSGIPVVAGDYPHLLWLNYLAKSHKVDDFKAILDNAKQAYDKLKNLKSLTDSNFDVFNRIRVDYMHKVLLQCVNSNPKTIAVVDNMFLNQVAQKFSVPEKVDYADISRLVKLSDQKLNEESFSNYLEKLVFFDFISGSFIHKYYASKKKFPFIVNTDYVGYDWGMQYLFVLWNHFRADFESQFKSLEKRTTEPEMPSAEELQEQEDEDPFGN